jgi:hypothetical protein
MISIQNDPDVGQTPPPPCSFRFVGRHSRRFCVVAAESNKPGAPFAFDSSRSAFGSSRPLDLVDIYSCLPIVRREYIVIARGHSRRLEHRR